MEQVENEDHHLKIIRIISDHENRIVYHSQKSISQKRVRRKFFVEKYFPEKHFGEKLFAETKSQKTISQKNHLQKESRRKSSCRKLSVEHDHHALYRMTVYHPYTDILHRLLESSSLSFLLSKHYVVVCSPLFFFSLSEHSLINIRTFTFSYHHDYTNPARIQRVVTRQASTPL